MAACESMGPARSLCEGIDQGRRECISAAASLMAYQWLQRRKPLPEFLIPLPLPFWQKQRIGFDPELKLAKEVGKLFGIPVLPLLKERLDIDRLLRQGEWCYRLEAKADKRNGLCDRSVLLVASRLNDGLFRSAGEALKPFFPAQINALAFVD